MAEKPKKNIKRIKEIITLHFFQIEVDTLYSDAWRELGGPDIQIYLLFRASRKLKSTLEQKKIKAQQKKGHERYFDDSWKFTNDPIEISYWDFENIFGYYRSTAQRSIEKLRALGFINRTRKGAFEWREKAQYVLSDNYKAWTQELKENSPGFVNRLKGEV